MIKSLTRRGHSRSAGKHSKIKLSIVPVIAFIVIVLAYFLYSGSTAPPTEGPTNTIPTDVSTANIGLEVGNLAPNFQLTDADGRIVTRESLEGRPVMIFFTTTWCVPCQIGAKELLKYDLETGGKAFNVVIIFVDSRETNDQIRQWKNNFGGSDWFTALDTRGVASDYQAKYLDTKYVLNKNGVIVWRDFYPLTYESAKNVLGPLVG